MVANVSFNPNKTTNAAGSFSTETVGYIQGIALDAPNTRNNLAGGVLAQSETIPMWGGVAIYEDVPSAISNSAPNPVLGGKVGRATALTGAKPLTGFSVFDQDHSMINTPQSPVPQAASDMSVHFYRLGSGARIAVKAADGLVNLQGELITTQVSWDFANQQLVPYAAAYSDVTITGAVWASTGGGQVNFTVGTDLSAVLNAGDVINVTDVVNTGGVATDVFNGAFVVKSVPDSTHVIVDYIAAGSPGTYASGGTITGGGGALPCKILDVQSGNSMTVDYDSDTGFATWDRSGTTVLILI